MRHPNRPQVVKEPHLDYLDNLRDSGATNMFGAAPYFMGAFPDVNRNEAREIILYWMKTFNQFMENGER